MEAEKSLQNFTPTGSCPIRDILNRLGDKWSMLVLLTLDANGVMRFSEIHRTLGDISHRMLTVTLENPGSDDPWGQVDLTPEAKIGLTPLPKIKMTPVDIAPAGDFICIFGFRFGRRGIKPKKHEYKVKKHSPVSRIGDGDKKHQQSF